MASYLIEEPTRQNVATIPVAEDNYYGVLPSDVVGMPGAMVLTVDGEPAVLAGISKTWDGFGNVWAFFSPAAKGHGMRIRTMCRWMLNQAMLALQLRRASTVVRYDNELYRRWARAVGFQPEAYLDKAAPDGSGLILYTYWRR